MARDIQYYDTRDIFRGLWGTKFKGKNVKEKEFIKVISTINQKIADAILEGNRIVNRRTINWPLTKQYGFYVRNDVDYRFKLVYNKNRVTYKNHIYMNFSPIRSLQEEFLRRAEDKEFECYKSEGTWQRNTRT